MNTQLSMVREFTMAFKGYMNEQPTASIPAEAVQLRISLMSEEISEYERAAETEDIVSIADALSDIAYVVLGTYLAHGLQDHAEALFAEVHRSNMTKLNSQGTPLHRADGKVLKSTEFREPDLKSILLRRR